MTADQVLTTCRQADIRLEAQGDRLLVDAPAGVLTPELRDALARHKAALLNRLRPSRGFVTLRPDARTGFTPTLPVEAVELAIELECRGYRQSVDAEGAYQIEPGAGLTDRDHAAIARWRRHLAAIVTYEAPRCA